MNDDEFGLVKHFGSATCKDSSIINKRDDNTKRHKFIHTNQHRRTRRMQDRNDMESRAMRRSAMTNDDEAAVKG